MNYVLDFFNYVFLCDEAIVPSNGDLNRPNMHYSAFENAHWMHKVDNQRYWTLNPRVVLIIGERIMGPHFFKGNLIGDNYNDFLYIVLPNLPMGLPKTVR